MARKIIETGPTFVHDPPTGGTNIGIPETPATGDESRTVTTWSEGTFMAPAAGVDDTTVRTLDTVVAVDFVPGPDPWRPSLCFRTRYTPVPATATTTMNTTPITRIRGHRDRGGSTSIW